jgi:hypothetical protein
MNGQKARRPPTTSAAGSRVSIESIASAKTPIRTKSTNASAPVASSSVPLIESAVG